MGATSWYAAATPEAEAGGAPGDEYDLDLDLAPGQSDEEGGLEDDLAGDMAATWTR